MIIIVALAVAFSALVAWLSFGLFFNDKDEFLDCLRFSMTPNLFSLFAGQYWEDIRKSSTLAFYVFLVVGSGALTYLGIVKLLG